MCEKLNYEEKFRLSNLSNNCKQGQGAVTAEHLNKDTAQKGAIGKLEGNFGTQHIK